MKIELGAWRPDVLEATLTALYGARTVASSTATKIVEQYPILNSPLLAYEEQVTEGSTSAPFTQTNTAFSITEVLKSGQRVPLVTITEGNWTQSSLTPDPLFGTGVVSTVFGVDDKGAFAAKYLGGNDTLTGNAGPNVFYAGAGNDRIQGGAGADRIDGGSGIDTSVHSDLAHSELLVSRRADGAVLIATKDGTTDRIVNVENFEFSDGTAAASALTYLPGHTEVPALAVQPVFRFYNARDKAFFYTTSAAERDAIIKESTDASYNPGNGVWPYFYQGATYEQAHSSAGSVPVFRFYNSKTGHHFFTTSVAERDVVLNESTDPNYGQPGLWPYQYEGEAFRAFADPNHKDAVPVYRFYSATLDRHFFTASTDEAAQIRLTGQWTEEGVGYWGEVAG